VGVFALAGIPPFVGFMGKLTLLSAALSKGYLALVIIAVLNAAIAVYYYLGVVKESWFRDPGNLPPIKLDWPTRALCVCLISGILALGVAPSRVLDTISTSVAKMNASAMTQAAEAGRKQDAVIATHLPEWSAAVPIGRN
jgi:NADH-quinone oxidoreductase subunit N